MRNGLACGVGVSLASFCLRGLERKDGSRGANSRPPSLVAEYKGHYLRHVWLSTHLAFLKGRARKGISVQGAASCFVLPLEKARMSKKERSNLRQLGQGLLELLGNRGGEVPREYCFSLLAVPSSASVSRLYPTGRMNGPVDGVTLVSPRLLHAVLSCLIIAGRPTS